MSIAEMRARRAQLVAELRSVLDLAETDKRPLTQEEENRWAALNAEVDALLAQIEREERVAKLQAETTGPAAAALKPEIGERQATPQAQELRSFLRGERGTGLLELRALQVDDPEAGGYTVRPQDFVAQLIKAVDNLVFVRQLATKLAVTSADSLGVPSLDADPADADWTVELGTGSEDSTMDFGKRSLAPHPLAKSIKVSKTLIRKSVLNIEALVADRLAYKFAVTEEQAFLTGDGQNKPLGVFTASDSGIPTSRDVSTGNTATTIGADGLIEAKYALKAAYWGRSRWVFHRDAIKMIRKLKDGEGQYLWQPGISGGAPDRILDIPFVMSEYAPSTFTTGLYVGILGDFSQYWIADALSMQLQTLVELYAATNQNGYIARLEVDGMPVLAEAFARVKLA